MCKISVKYFPPFLFSTFIWFTWFPGICLPLLTDADGNKIGKSTQGGVTWLGQNRTSNFRFYQFFMQMHETEAVPLFTKLRLGNFDKLIAFYVCFGKKLELKSNYFNLFLSDQYNLSKRRKAFEITHKACMFQKIVGIEMIQIEHGHGGSNDISKL